MKKVKKKKKLFKWGLIIWDYTEKKNKKIKKCHNCKNIMREWFNSQVLTGYSCDNCREFVSLTFN